MQDKTENSNLSEVDYEEKLVEKFFKIDENLKYKKNLFYLFEILEKLPRLTSYNYILKLSNNTKILVEFFYNVMEKIKADFILDQKNLKAKSSYEKLFEINKGCIPNKTMEDADQLVLFNITSRNLHKVNPFFIITGEQNMLPLYKILHLYNEKSNIQKYIILNFNFEKFVLAHWIFQNFNILFTDEQNAKENIKKISWILKETIKYQENLKNELKKFFDLLYKILKSNDLKQSSNADVNCNKIKIIIDACSYISQSTNDYLFNCLITTINKDEIKDEITDFKKCDEEISKIISDCALNNIPSSVEIISENSKIQVKNKKSLLDIDKTFLNEIFENTCDKDELNKVVKLDVNNSTSSFIKDIITDEIVNFFSAYEPLKKEIQELFTDSFKNESTADLELMLETKDIHFQNIICNFQMENFELLSHTMIEFFEEFLEIAYKVLTGEEKFNKFDFYAEKNVSAEFCSYDRRFDWLLNSKDSSNIANQRKDIKKNHLILIQLNISDFLNIIESYIKNSLITLPENIQLNVISNTTKNLSLTIKKFQNPIIDIIDDKLIVFYATEDNLVDPYIDYLQVFDYDKNCTKRILLFFIHMFVVYEKFFQEKILEKYQASKNQIKKSISESKKNQNSKTSELHAHIKKIKPKNFNSSTNSNCIFNKKEYLSSFSLPSNIFEILKMLDIDENIDIDEKEFNLKTKVNNE